MKNSLEFAVEDFFLRMLRSTSLLKGKELVHFEEERTAKSNAIIVQAKAGNRNLAGPGGYDLEVMVEFRAPAKTTKRQNDLTAGAIWETAENQSQAVLQKIKTSAGLEFIVIKDESSSDRQNSQELRKRTMTFPVQAKLA